MTQTTQRKASIMDFQPKPKEDECSEMSDDQPVGVRIYRSPEDSMAAMGVVFQKCGGGRRILRKRIGAS